MVILVKDETGVEKAINMADGGWEAVPVEGNDSVVNLVLKNEYNFIISIDVYNKIKEQLIREGTLYSIIG